MSQLLQNPTTRRIHVIIYNWSQASKTSKAFFSLSLLNLLLQVTFISSTLYTTWNLSCQEPFRLFLLAHVIQSAIAISFDIYLYFGYSTHHEEDGRSGSFTNVSVEKVLSNIIRIKRNKLGISQKEISTLPIYQLSTKEKEEEERWSSTNTIPIIYIPNDQDRLCVICLSTYEKNDILCKLWCEHHFHRECIFEWLKLNATMTIENKVPTVTIIGAGEQKEILNYLKNVASKYNMLEYTDFETKTEIAYFDLIYSAMGTLDIPNVPELFKPFHGPIIHSAEWDHSIDFTGKRIAIIESGASAIQTIPHVAKSAAQLIAYQRSAPWIIPQVISKTAKIQQLLFRKFPFILFIYRLYLFFIFEALYILLGYPRSFFTNYLATKIISRHKRTITQLGRVDLLDKLLPKFQIGCKRGGYSGTYYEAITRPNVSIVDEPIQIVGENSITTMDGVSREIDILVLATGFKTYDTTLDNIQRPYSYLGHNSTIFNGKNSIKKLILCKHNKRGPMIEPKLKSHDDYMKYIRSCFKDTTWVSSCISCKVLGLPEPTLRLLCTVISAYPVANHYKKKFSSERVQASTAAELTIAISYGLCYVFGEQLGDRQLAAAGVWIFNALYLLAGYYFMQTDEYDITWTMTQCILCLRMMGFGFDYYDGSKRVTVAGPPSKTELKDPNKENVHKMTLRGTADKKPAVDLPLSFMADTPLVTLPSIIDLLAYALFPSAFLVGPQFSFSLFQKWIHEDLRDLPHSEREERKRAQTVYTWRCAILAILYLGLQQTVGAKYSTSYLLTDEFRALGFLKRVWIFAVTGKFTYNKYIGIWLLTEGATASFGISFEGINEEGHAQYGGLANTLPSIYEKATSIDHVISAFNINTNLWSKYYVFKRLKFLGSKEISQAGTLAFLAIWHGFHAMYFITFLLEFLYVQSELVLRRRLVPLVEPYTKKNEVCYYVWKAVAWITCQLCITYAVVGFDLLKISINQFLPKSKSITKKKKGQ
ncbi:MBOAT, membrane-bound O-acyltransferase family-domain-containing protein [Cokeromyces recurvatus]|uniref:MBOAT, membrane-bound O-acyltransferase family-domain-containing protein n=1 Tax=Cokeromyces recurvatus TaxID=90255 RepID=UPI002220FEFA|nr:MBOAT, membrane-bound O-acyltransferase family-domain-containing protein [Cokeromyces recurvatus]KAI7903179.1 MBOAT, membrane-bound O-acyltransferase family-domain-containing protein [Cokeromyces recurvatus]